jgi:PAS domain S-box-containing protein
MTTDIKISSELLKEERLKGAWLSVNFRWMTIFLATSSLLFGHRAFGFDDVTHHPVIPAAILIVSNLLFFTSLRKKYNPRYFGFAGVVIDVAIMFYIIDGLAANYDPLAVTAVSILFLIPTIYLIYTFRLDRGLMLFLIGLSLILFNIVYLRHYLAAPELFTSNISLAPVTHFYKSFYLGLTGLLCIYLQSSIGKLIRRQISETEHKAELDAEIRLEREKNIFAAELIEKEKTLNSKLAEEIAKRDVLAEKLKEKEKLVDSIISNLAGAVYRSAYDDNFTTKFGSAKIRDITGYPVEDFIENKRISFTQLIHPDDINMVRSTLDKKVYNGLPYSLEFRIFHQSGKTVWVHINGHPYREGDSYFLDGIVTDITEKKIAEQELITTKQELEQLNQKLEKTVEERTARLTEANTQLLKLQKENLQSQFEVLKQQVNPHFLFNSLNVLTSLIKVDPDIAEVFTERLSKVYRYVLEQKDKDLVSLATEMDCIRAYIFLLDIRFSDKVFVKVNFDETRIDASVVPLALQLLIENAIKHNTFSKKSPLHIELFIDNEGYLNITNNLQNRNTRMGSTGIGLVNISKRYSLLSDVQPVFEMTGNQFIARIPLIFNGNRATTETA